MSERLSGNGNNGASDYKVWKRWARATLVVEQSGGMNQDTFGAVVVLCAGWTRSVGTGCFRYLRSDCGRLKRKCFPRARREVAQTRKVVAHRMGEARLGRRAGLLFTRWQKESVDLSS